MNMEDFAACVQMCFIALGVMGDSRQALNRTYSGSNTTLDAIHRCLAIAS